MDFVNDLETLQAAALESLASGTTPEALEAWRIEYLGSKGKVKAAMGAMIVPSHVLGGRLGHRAPSDILNVAIVGAGGMGAENAQRLGSENIVAVCDIDHVLVAKKVEERLTNGQGEPREEGHRWKEQYERARKYSHFEVMLDESPEIDAVLIATPDHTHAVIAMEMLRGGRNIYIEKPIALVVHLERWDADREYERIGIDDFRLRTADDSLKQLP